MQELVRGCVLQLNSHPCIDQSKKECSVEMICMVESGGCDMKYLEPSALCKIHNKFVLLENRTRGM